MPPKKKKAPLKTKVPVGGGSSYADEMRLRTAQALEQEVEEAAALAVGSLDEDAIDDIIAETKLATSARADKGEYHAHVVVPLPLWEGAGNARVQQMAQSQMKDIVTKSVEEATGLTLSRHLGYQNITLVQSTAGSYNINFAVDWKPDGS